MWFYEYFMISFYGQLVYFIFKVLAWEICNMKWGFAKIHDKVTETVYAWFEYLWIRHYYRSVNITDNVCTSKGYSSILTFRSFTIQDPSLMVLLILEGLVLGPFKGGPYKMILLVVIICKIKVKPAFKSCKKKIFCKICSPV